MLWSSITWRIRHKKINEQVNKYLYTCILQHTQVVQSQISNDCLKVSIGDQSEPQLVPKLLPLVSVWDLQNIIVIPPEECGVNNARDADNNTMISDYTLRSIIPPQFNKMSAQ